MQNLDWDKLKSFYRVVKLGGFTKASIKMGVNQSSVSRQVQRLERQLGVKIFDRSYKELKLTKEGEILFEITHKMVSDAASIESLLSKGKNEPQGTLKVATTIALASMWLPYYVNSFFEKYPDMKLTIIGDDNELDLNIREADASIRPFMLYHDDYIQKHITTFNLRLYASQSYLETFGDPKTAEDLDNHRLITFGDDTTHPYGNINWLLRIGRKNKQSRIPFMKINVGPGILMMAERGVGIVALSKEYMEANDSKLINILPHIEGPAVDIFYTYPKQSIGYKNIEVFGKYLEDLFKKKSEAHDSQ